MIFYFSGTGNSLWAAQVIAERQGERLYSIADELKQKDNPLTYALEPKEKLGFVFPVYAWSPPKIVLDFIHNMKLTGYSGQYVFAICTCGGDAGYTLNVLNKALKKHHIELNSGFSIIMPDNYVVMFDVPSPEAQEKKLAEAKRILQHINEVISHERDKVFECKEGPVPLLKTGIANRFFNAFALKTKSFYAKENCTSCGLCENVCSTATIKLVDGRPTWGKICSQCMACINRCPVGAIQYGKATQKRGRYYNPYCK
ncbi:MAG: EFR1 family ferrodoxin [Bacillota bacterium]|jgi:NAD-dependent dihydropyrimidine dehydrogenase PreA subunit